MNKLAYYTGYMEKKALQAQTYFNAYKKLLKGQATKKWANTSQMRKVVDRLTKLNDKTLKTVSRTGAALK